LKKADLVNIGSILRSEGRDGKLKLRLHEKNLPGLTCGNVYLRRNEEFEEFEVESLELDRNSTFLKLKGIDTLAQSDALTGLAVFVEEGCFRPLGGGCFYEFQVIGSRVVTRDGTEIGTVASILPAGGGHLLVVSRGGNECYVPFAEPICLRVDPEAKEIVIDPPDGLLDLNEI
jgi:16S rRNA processing protein RimM